MGGHFPAANYMKSPYLFAYLVDFSELKDSNAMASLFLAVRFLSFVLLWNGAKYKSILAMDLVGVNLSLLSAVFSNLTYCLVAALSWKGELQLLSGQLFVGLQKYILSTT